jgi:DNA-binding response OmpR family regulator
MPDRVFIIEDDKEIADMLRFNLEAEGYATTYREDGESGLRQVSEEPPDLLLLDLILPGLDGLEICQQLKASPKTAGIPIIMVTAKGHESDIVLGLKLGADDYVTKPFSVRELIARIRAVLRRHRVPTTVDTPRQIVREGLVIDLEKREVLLDGAAMQLRPAEYKLLCFLASQPGRVLTRDQLLDHVAGDEAALLPHNIDVRIAEIRRKLGSYRHLVETVWSVGYRFSEEEE